DPAMIVGSFLYSRAGWTDPDRISGFVCAIARAVGKTGNSLDDVRRTSRAGWERGQGGGKNIAGFPKLRAHFGEETAQQFAKLLGCQVGSGKNKDDEE